MSQVISKSPRQAGRSVLAEAKHKTNSPWVERLERFGYITRGAIYALIGILALQLAIGAGGATASPTSAIALIGKQPFGKYLMILVAIGLFGYALWGFVRAIFDPLGRGSDSKGLFARAGFLFSAVSYTLLLIPTVLALLGKSASSAFGSSTGSLPAALTSGPLGKWLVIAFGVFWIAAGVSQLVVAYDDHFMRDLKTGAMNAKETQMMTWLGKAGYAARGIVFALIGVIILQTTFAVGASQAKGFDGALAALAHAPYGEILLGAVAIGLILFGVFSALCAKWVQTGTRRAA